MGTKSTRSAGTQHTKKGTVQGSVLVCSDTGNPIGCVVDQLGNTRLLVDTSLSISNAVVEVDLDYDNDGVHVGKPGTSNVLNINADGSIDVNTEVDAADGDNIAISGHANPIFDENSDTITTSSFKQIYSFTSSDNNTKIISIECTVSTPSTLRLRIDGDLKRELRTSPGNRNIKFNFDEHRPLLSGETITVEAKVERLIKSSYNSFTSLEGYIA